MEIAMGAIGPLLPKLGELLVGELTLEKQVRKGIESLVTELTLMHAALRKVAKVPPDQLDEGVKIWAGHVKELSYQMEEIIDVFMVRVEDGSKKTNPKNRVKKIVKKVKRLFKNGKNLHRISGALEEAVHEAKKLAEQRQRYELEMRDTINNGASVDPRVMALYTDVSELVGIEETRDKLINMLTKDDDWSKHPLKTVSIVGFGGLGKTTLAKAAYDKIKVQFDCGAFVSVSQKPEMKKVFKDILYGLDKVKYENIHNAARDENHLIDDIIEFLNDKRYLIVIDDVWSEKAWKLIQCAFSKKSPGSRLVTTTRIISVSEACCSSEDDIYRMKPLSDDVSRTLFYKRVFSYEEGCPQELLQVSEDILKKCGGIPLAIITIASLLANKNQIKAKDQWYALLSSIGRGLTQDQSMEEMKKILLFSYYDLPSYLKPCLLYLSIFPEDHKIMRGRLIWRWVSEGLVYSDKRETSLYELGDSYFNELVNRSMIQAIGIDNEEKVEACRVHDMVLDLICSLSSEENFVTVLDDTGRKMCHSQSKIHRLSVQNIKVEVANMSTTQVRSLTVYENDTVDQLLKISRFQLLRVLDLEGCRISDIAYVGNLFHLRYLGLNGYMVTELPMEIGKLQFLQTIDLRNTAIINLPASISRLRRLMCLYLAEGMELPPGMCNLTSLEVLEGPMVGKFSSSRLDWRVGPSVGSNYNIHLVEELGHLTKLRVLRFVWGHLDESMCQALIESLNSLHKLECLDINEQGGQVDLIREGWMPSLQLRKLEVRRQTRPFWTLPAWIHPSSLPLLSYLFISVDEVRSEDIQILGTLPALRCLRLWGGDHFTGEHKVEMYTVTSDAFPSATECLFFYIMVVPSIFPLGAAPRLKNLGFSFPATWITRDDFDLGMGHLPSLQTVQVNLIGRNASAWELNEAFTALEAAANDHPNSPDLRIRRW